MFTEEEMSIPAAQNFSKLAVEQLENIGNWDLEKHGSVIAKERQEALNTKRNSLTEIIYGETIGWSMIPPHEAIGRVPA